MTEEVKNENQTQEPKYDEGQLLAIFDDLIFQDGYSEELNIRGRFPVTLRTRTGEEYEKIASELDKVEIKTMLAYENMASMLNLCFAVSVYNGKNLDRLDFEERLKIIKKLPSPILSLLSSELHKFDRKVEAACKVGKENF